MRLERSEPWNWYSRFAEFQFHKGAIRTFAVSVVAIKIDDFNSIKVRLEHWCRQERNSEKRIFQFHKGAIRTVDWYVYLYLHWYFNSIKVRLERHLFPNQHQCERHFNSIKVRLEQGSEERKDRRGWFQFHKGAIRTKVTIECPKKKSEFQFHKGAIRTQSWTSSGTTYLISIP